MADTKDFFCTLTQRLFSNWTALKLCVEHGMGSTDDAVEFHTYIAEVLCLNEKLDSSDLIEELEEYLDTLFSTKLEDDSSIDVAHQLLNFHRCWMDGNKTIATEKLASLPPLQQWIVPAEPVVKKHKELSTVTSETDCDMQTDTDRQSDTMVSEWEEVRSRRKK